MRSIDIISITHILFIFYWSRWSCPETELWGVAQLPVSSVMPPDWCLAMHTSNSWALGTHLSDARQQPLAQWWVSIEHNPSQWEANRLLCWGFWKEAYPPLFSHWTELKCLKLPHPFCNYRGSTGLRRVNLEEADQIGLTKPSVKPLVGWMDSSLDWILHLTLCGNKFSSYLSQLDGFLLLVSTRILGSTQAGYRIPNFRQCKEGN